MEIPENDFFKLLGGVADESYFVIDLHNNEVVYLSAAFKHLWGIQQSDIQEQPELLWQYIHPDDYTYVNEKLAILKKGKTVKAEFRILVNEETKHVGVNVYALKGQDKLMAGNATDLTNLKDNIFYTEKINARKNAMLAILAHDLKEPVAIINMMASAIKTDAAVAGNSGLLNYVQVIQDLCDRNITLIRDMMQQEFIESPQVGIRKERSELVKAIDDIVKQYKNSEGVLDQHFNFKCNPNQIYAVVDMLKIGQCINNLIANAIKFTPRGGNIEVELQEIGDSVQISVADNGIGIPADMQPYLFEHRTSAHRPGLRGEEGAGIGLSIIHLLVELHGGKAWMESQINEGSTFYISLPKGY